MKLSFYPYQITVRRTLVVNYLINCSNYENNKCKKFVDNIKKSIAKANQSVKKYCY